MPSTTSPTLRQAGAITILSPGAAARTPFGTRFFRLALDPDPDTGLGTGTFAKRPLGRRMGEEVGAWGKLQRTGKLRENRAYAGVLQENRFAGHSDGGGAGGSGGVAGAGYPGRFVPADVDGTRVQGDSASTGGDDNSNDDRLWPDTYSTASDSDIDYMLDGFVVIDKADATGSVFWNQPRRRRRKIARGKGAEGPSLWSRFLSRLRPGKKVHQDRD